jgi:hypothetical protein
MLVIVVLPVPKDITFPRVVIWAMAQVPSAWRRDRSAGILKVSFYESPILCAMPSSDATAAKRRSAVQTW